MQNKIQLFQSENSEEGFANVFWSLLKPLVCIYFPHIVSFCFTLRPLINHTCTYPITYNISFGKCNVQDCLFTKENFLIDFTWNPEIMGLASTLQQTNKKIYMNWNHVNSDIFLSLMLKFINCNSIVPFARLFQWTNCLTQISNK